MNTAYGWDGTPVRHRHKGRPLLRKKRETRIIISPDPQHLQALPALSQATVSIMINHFDYLTHSNRGFRIVPNFFTEEQLHDHLFAMGFAKDFLDVCQWQYYWAFRDLLPALYEGTFKGAAQRLGTEGARLEGQEHLRGFATLLMGLYAGSELGMMMGEGKLALERALARDGWRFDGKRLVEIRKQTIDEPKEILLVEHLIAESVHDRREVLLHHFRNGQRLYDEGNYHPCSGEWRSFLEEMLRGVWRLTRCNRAEYKTFAETPAIRDVFSFLNRAGFLDSDEELAFRSSYGFLSAGGHPGIGEKDDAYLSQVLALTFGHALLLKLESWHLGGYAHF